MSKFKLGDKVKIKSNLKRYSGATDKMYKYEEMIATIKAVFMNGTYFIDLDDTRFYWSEDMLEEIPLPLPQPHKSLLKSGYKVIYRNGETRYVFLPTKEFLDINAGFRSHMNWYTDDLTRMSDDKIFDIVEIFNEEGELVAKRNVVDLEVEEFKKQAEELKKQLDIVMDKLKKLDK